MRMDKRAILVCALMIALSAIAIICAAYYVGIQFESTDEEPRGDLNVRFAADIRNRTVDGVRYDYNERLFTVLFIGVDWDEQKQREMIDMYYPNREPTQEEIRAVRGLWNGGQADFLMLAVINPDEKTVTRIPIDRDTMTEINTTTLFGADAGTMVAQISLSHGYGDGGEISCENTVKAVEMLLGGVSVDAYAAMDMGSIPLLNDALGGVTVTIREDLTAIDPAFYEGAVVTLLGKQAEAFTRARMSVGQGTNAERMARQSDYVSAAIDRIRGVVTGDKEFAGRLFDTLGESLVTNMGRARAVNETVRASAYTVTPMRSIPGEHRPENGFMAFYPDRDAVDSLVLDLFYDVWK